MIMIHCTCQYLQYVPPLILVSYDLLAASILQRGSTIDDAANGLSLLKMHSELDLSNYI